MVRKSAPDSSRWVAKQCLIVCGWTLLSSPARTAACCTASQTLLDVTGDIAVGMSASTGEQVSFRFGVRRAPVVAKFL